MNRPDCPVTGAYLRQCAAEGADGLGGVAERLRLPPCFSAAYPGAVLARPLFVARAALERVAEQVAGFQRLLASLPDRLFGGDVRAYCAELGMDGRKTDLLRRFADTPSPVYGRADLHRDGERWRLLEYNAGSVLGGVERAGVIPAALLEVERFRRFAEQHRLDHVSPGRHVARMLRQAAESVSAGDRPVVVLLEADGRIARYGTYMRPFQEHLRAEGIDLRLAELGELRESGGRLRLGPDPVDVVLRYVSLGQMYADPSVEARMEPVFRAHERGRTALVTPLSTCLHDSKGVLPLLSAPGHRSAFTAQETELIDQLLPWTRSMADRHLDVSGGRRALAAYCADHREDLIIKPYDGLRGEGIVAGWENDAGEWEKIVERHLGRDCIVQHRATPQPEPVWDPDTGTVTDWHATWGVYVTDEGYAGTYVRALPAGGASGVVGWDAKPRFAGVFSYPGAPPSGHPGEGRAC